MPRLKAGEVSTHLGLSDGTSSYSEPESGNRFFFSNMPVSEIYLCSLVAKRRRKQRELPRAESHSILYSGITGPCRNLRSFYIKRVMHIARKLNARKFFSNEYLRHYYFSTATGCALQVSSRPRLPCSLLYSLHKKSEQSFFARVKVRRSTTTPFFSIDPPRCRDIATPLQHAVMVTENT